MALLFLFIVVGFIESAPCLLERDADKTADQNGFRLAARIGGGLGLADSEE